MDPSYGLITKQKDEFNKSYTGVAILFKNHNPYLLNNVINRKSILLITILILLFTLLSLFYSYLLSYLVESISTKNNLIILFLSLTFTTGLGFKGLSKLSYKSNAFCISLSSISISKAFKISKANSL